MSSSQQMHVEVIDSLAAVWAGVDDETKTVVEMLLLCNFRCSTEQLAEEFGFAEGGVREGAEVLLGNDQNMHGGLRIDVREGEHVIVLKEARDGDCAGGDFAEEAVHTYRV